MIKRSGFIAIVGRPNVGKSTLLNALVGEKLAIVSSKPQTTRTRIMGIQNTEESQLIYLDTPGFHKPRTRLGQKMVGVVNQSIGDVDCILLVVEPKPTLNENEQAILQKIQASGMPAILVINKVDEIKKTELLPVMDALSKTYPYVAIVPVSARQGENLSDLVAEMERHLPEGPAFFPEEMLTDQPEKQIVAEIIREKLLRLLDDEVPHGTAVEILQMKEKKGGMLDISANIYCEKESHKGIIIGKKGAMLKKVGTYAREDIERFFGVKCYLQLWVKVKDDWRNSNFQLKEFGFGEDPEADYTL
ncbi:MAG: GTPase Era [Eubacteriales bacterium]|jgi:GTP-binding protein Era